MQFEHASHDTRSGSQVHKGHATSLMERPSGPPIIGKEKSVKSETCGIGDLGRIISLLTHEDTCGLSERHLVVLRHLCKTRRGGFRYQELPLVEQLLPLVEEKVVLRKESKLRALFLKLLDICSLAPVRDRANEDLTTSGLTASSALFRALGGILWSKDYEVQATTAEVLRKVAAGNDPDRPSTPDNAVIIFGECPDDLRPKPRDINQALLLECGVVTSVVSCLDRVVVFLLENVENAENVSLESSSFGAWESGEREGLSRLAGEKHDLETPPQNEQETGEKEGEENGSGEEAGGGGAHPEAVEPLGLDPPKAAAPDIVSNVSALESLLRFIRELSTNSESSAAMIETGLVPLLVKILGAARGIRDPILSVSIEVLWNCLEHSQVTMREGLPSEGRTALIRKARKRNTAFALSTLEGVSALRDTIQTLLVEGFRKKDKELRNEAVIVASLLASNSRSHSLFRTTGTLELLLRYATALETGLARGDPEVEKSEPRAPVFTADDPFGDSSAAGRERTRDLGALADPRNFASVAEVDLELKLLFWSLLADLSKRDASNLRDINASPLMETLLMYMDLVVEEGLPANGTELSVNRSVSLATMSHPSACRVRPGSSSTTRLRNAIARSRDHEASPRESQDLGLDQVSSAISCAASFAARKASCRDRSGKNGTLSSGNDKASSPDAWTRGGLTSAEETEVWQAPPIPRLYVPPSVARLPLASIQLLQGQAMASLLVLAPRFPEKFQALGGHVVTLRLLDRLGARQENQKLVKAATRMLTTVADLPELKQELGQMGGVRIMLDRFTCEGPPEQRFGRNPGAGNDRHNRSVGGEGSEDLRTDTVVMLCRLCEGCPRNQEAFREADGIPKMMAAIKCFCRARSEARQGEGSGANSGGVRGETCGSGSSSALPMGLGAGEQGAGSAGSRQENVDPGLVHIVDCIWCAVVGNRRSEARLLQCEGLDTLLDLLELCPIVMRHQVTGVIADLLHNKRSIPYARAWRSDLNMWSISQLMVRLWIAEEDRLGVSRPDGVLQNIWQPLQSHSWASHRRRGTAETTPRPLSASPFTARPLPGGTGNFEEALSGPHAKRNDDDSDARAVDGGGSSVQGETQGASSASALLSFGDEVGHPCETRGEERNHTPGVSGIPQANASNLGLDGRLKVILGGQRELGKDASRLDCDASLSKVMGHLDLRGKIAGVLRLVGFDVERAHGLGPSELKAAYMATSYLDFLEGEAWQKVAAELEAQQINPIAADTLVLDTMLEKAFNQAHEVKSKQRALTAEQRARDGKTEKAFFDAILFQRDQEIRQAVIKRNALIPGATKKRLAAKRAVDRAPGKREERCADADADADADDDGDDDVEDGGEDGGNGDGDGDGEDLAVFRSEEGLAHEHREDDDEPNNDDEC